MKLKILFKDLFKNITLKATLIIILGCLIQAVGIYNIHSISGVTEGGVLGLLLLLEYWIGLSPAISCIILNAICYFIGYKALGKDFIIYSVLSIVSFSIFYGILEQFPRIYPEIANYPLIASILGAIFIGIGAGLTVKYGAASSGDDAIAMTVSKKFNVKIQTVYLFSDLSVMLLSLTYIPFTRIIYSLLTVLISGQIIGFMVKNDENNTEDKLKNLDKTIAEKDVNDENKPTIPENENINDENLTKESSQTETIIKNNDNNITNNDDINNEENIDIK